MIIDNIAGNALKEKSPAHESRKLKAFRFKFLNHCSNEVTFKCSESFCSSDLQLSINRVFCFNILGRIGANNKVNQLIDGFIKKLAVSHDYLGREKIRRARAFLLSPPGDLRLVFIEFWCAPE